MQDTMTNDNLLKHGNIMLTASVVSMFLNYLFHVIMGRTLGPVEYGILGSLLSIFYIFTIPVATIQTVIALFVSKYNANNEIGKVHSILFKSLKKFMPYAILTVFIIYLSSWTIADFLNIPTNTPVIVFGAVLFFSILTPVTIGVLQGLQNFNHLALNSTLSATFKLVVGLTLVYLGFGVNGAMAAYGASAAFTFFLCYFPLRFLVHQKAEEIQKREIYSFSIPVVAVIAAFNVMMNIDLIMVKHYLDPVDAGYYTALSMIAKVIFFGAMAISSVMFPKAAARHTNDHQHSFKILSQSMLYVGVLSAVAVTGLYFFSEEIMSFMYGKSYISVAPLLAPFGLATTFFGLSNIISYYQLSTNNVNFVVILVLLTILEVTFMLIFHNTIQQIILVVVAASFLMFMSLLVEGIYEKRKLQKIRGAK